MMEQLLQWLYGTKRSRVSFDLEQRQRIHDELQVVCQHANADLQRIVFDHFLSDILATQPPEKVAALRQRFDTALTESLPLNLTAVTDRILDEAM